MTLPSYARFWPGLLLMGLFLGCNPSPTPVHNDRKCQERPAAKDLMIRQVIFPPQGPLLLAFDIKNNLYLFDAEKQFRLWEGRIEGIRTAQFFPDGKRVAFGCNDGRVLVWDVEKRQILAEFFSHAQDIAHLLVMPDQRRLISAGSNLDGAQGMEIKIWDLDKKSLQTSLGGAHKRPGGLRLAQDGQTVLMRVVEEVGGKAQTFLEKIDPVAGKVTHRQPLTGYGLPYLASALRLVSVQFEPNLIVIYSYPELKELGSSPHSLEGLGLYPQLSKDGEKLVIVDIKGNVTIWSVEPLQLVHTLKIPFGDNLAPGYEPIGRVSSVTISANSKVVAVGGSYRPSTFQPGLDEIEFVPMIMLFDLESGKPVVSLKAL